jgi:hypothetical protein
MKRLLIILAVLLLTGCAPSAQRDAAFNRLQIGDAQQECITLMGGIPVSKREYRGTDENGNPVAIWATGQADLVYVLTFKDSKLIEKHRYSTEVMKEAK